LSYYVYHLNKYAYLKKNVLQQLDVLVIKISIM
jgi:hypothetical protein